MISAGTLAASFGDFVELRPDQVPGALAQFQAKQRRAELLNAKAWPAVLVVTIVPGLLAAGTLLAAFARPMLQG